MNIPVSGEHTAVTYIYSLPLPLCTAEGHYPLTVRWLGKPPLQACLTSTSCSCSNSQEAQRQSICNLCREQDVSNSNRASKGVRFQPSLSAVTEGSVDTQSSRSSLSSMAESPFQKASIQKVGQIAASHSLFRWLLSQMSKSMQLCPFRPGAETWVFLAQYSCCIQGLLIALLRYFSSGSPLPLQSAHLLYRVLGNQQGS